MARLLGVESHCRSARRSRQPPTYPFAPPTVLPHPNRAASLPSTGTLATPSRRATAAGAPSAKQQRASRHVVAAESQRRGAQRAAIAARLDGRSPWSDGHRAPRRPAAPAHNERPRAARDATAPLAKGQWCAGPNECRACLRSDRRSHVLRSFGGLRDADRGAAQQRSVRLLAWLQAGPSANALTVARL